MDGRISCESTEGKGTIFKIELPLARASVSSVPAKSEPAKEVTLSNESVRVLIVEDNEINQQLIEAHMNRIGCPFTIVSNGFDAIDEVQKETYDIIFMDVNMPKMSGYETTGKIRELDIKQPKIYALTAHAFDEDRNDSKDAGMDGHITKPFKRKDLIAAIDAIKKQDLAS